MPVKGLRERLRDGESVICAEGYLWELERRGYLKSGIFAPEIVLDQPDRVLALHEEFVHAGSDVVEAYTYFGHREKLRLLGREADLEQLNLTALALARKVADEHGCLMAGNICNTTIYDPNDPKALAKIEAIFKENVEWAVQGGADFVIAETYPDFGEAKMALEAIQKYGNGMPAVITITPYFREVTADDIPLPQALRKLEELGADVVGFNCGRGPATMMPVLREARKVCKGPVAAVPVPFRTTPEEKTWQSLRDPATGKDAYPLDLSPLQCSRSEIRAFAEEARDLGIQYIGLCCGNSSFYLREVAQAYGRQPPACKYAPQLHFSTSVGDWENMPPRKKALQLHQMGRRAAAPNKAK